MGGLDQKNLLITGGSRGIGAAVARVAMREGANVGFTYARRRDAAASLCEELGRAYPQQRIAMACCEMRDGAASEGAVTNLAKELGGVDALVNNAGMVRDNPLLRMSEEEWSSVLDANLRSVFFTTRPLVFEFMKRKRGTIINMSSVAGVYGNAGQANYAASKSGLIGFTRALAKEVGGYGVTVNAVAPGFIATDMTDGLSEQQEKEHRKRIPLRRFGEPEEVAELVCFLASDRARYITGQVLGIDGGMTL